MALDFDRSILGQVFDTTDFPPVTKEEIVNFAAALGETNPLYTDEAAAAQSPYGGLVAPPTFVTKLRAKKFTPEHLPLPIEDYWPDLQRCVEYHFKTNIQKGTRMKPVPLVRRQWDHL